MSHWLNKRPNLLICMKYFFFTCMPNISRTILEQSYYRSVVQTIMAGYDIKPCCCINYCSSVQWFSPANKDNKA